MQSGDRVHDEQQHVRFLHRLQHLAANLDVHRNVRIVGETAGVHEPEGAAIPHGTAEVTVARGAGLVAHDRRVVADDAIEELRLTDVRAADDGDDGDGHD